MLLANESRLKIPPEEGGRTIPYTGSTAPKIVWRVHRQMCSAGVVPIPPRCTVPPSQRNLPAARSVQADRGLCTRTRELSANIPDTEPFLVSRCSGSVKRIRHRQTITLCWCTRGSAGPFDRLACLRFRRAHDSGRRSCRAGKRLLRRSFRARQWSARYGRCGVTMRSNGVRRKARLRFRGGRPHPFANGKPSRQSR